MKKLSPGYQRGPLRALQDLGTAALAQASPQQPVSPLVNGAGHQEPPQTRAPQPVMATDSRHLRSGLKGRNGRIESAILC